MSFFVFLDNDAYLSCPWSRRVDPFRIRPDPEHPNTQHRPHLTKCGGAGIAPPHFCQFEALSQNCEYYLDRDSAFRASGWRRAFLAGPRDGPDAIGRARLDRESSWILGRALLPIDDRMGLLFDEAALHHRHSSRDLRFLQLPQQMRIQSIAERTLWFRQIVKSRRRCRDRSYQQRSPVREPGCHGLVLHHHRQQNDTHDHKGRTRARGCRHSLECCLDRGASYHWQGLDSTRGEFQLLRKTEFRERASWRPAAIRSGTRWVRVASIATWEAVGNGDGSRRACELEKNGAPRREGTSDAPGPPEPTMMLVWWVPVY